MEKPETEALNSTVFLSDPERDQLIQEMDNVFGNKTATILIDKMWPKVEEIDIHYYRSIKYFYDTADRCYSIIPVFRRVLWDINVFLGAGIYRSSDTMEKTSLCGKLVENLEALKKVGANLFVDTNRIEVIMALCVDLMRVIIQNESQDILSGIDENEDSWKYPKKMKNKLDSVNTLIQANKYRLQLYSSIRKTIVLTLNSE